MDVIIRCWRQRDPESIGRFESYDMRDVSVDASLLEVLDVLNEQLIEEGIEPIAFESDCREGICGTCGVMINGRAHGPLRGAATCQLHMRHFKDGDTIVLEPFRAAAFPLIRDLMINRSALDEIVAAGGYISVNTGAAPDANIVLVPKDAADAAFDAAACIQCGACVAACPNAAAHLFTSAKLEHLNLLPQGQPERSQRTEAMVEAMESYFGSCTLHGECHVACPKEISLDFIAYMNRDFVRAKIKNRRLGGQR